MTLICVLVDQLCTVYFRYYLCEASPTVGRGFFCHSNLPHTDLLPWYRKC